MADDGVILSQAAFEQTRETVSRVLGQPTDRTAAGRTPPATPRFWAKLTGEPTAGVYNWTKLNSGGGVLAEATPSGSAPTGTGARATSGQRGLPIDGSVIVELIFDGYDGSNQPAYLFFWTTLALTPCRVQQVAGSAGSSSTTCSFTYDIYRLDNSTKINTTGGAVTPKGPPRLANVAYTAATYGCYFRDVGGAYVLQVWDESYGTGSCP